MSPAFVQVPWTTPVFLTAAGDFRGSSGWWSSLHGFFYTHSIYQSTHDKVVEQKWKG